MIQIFTSRYEKAIANSFSSLASSIRLNSSFMVRYMTPGSFGEPNIVCVLPAPVAPYANTAIELQLKMNYYKVRHVYIKILLIANNSST